MVIKERYSKENFENAVMNATSIREALEILGLRAAGGNYKVFHKYVDKYELSTSHFESKKTIYERSLGNSNKLRKIDLSDILIENSSYNRGHLKKRLYDDGIKKRECEICGQGEIWNGNKMSLILDHINGIHNDNRIKNLRIVCPNCNATLPTHCGKNK
jgi:hypothetical protein